MAIVVLIIGLILSLVMKGTDMIDQVTWKRDVQAYEHLQAALLLLREDQGKMPGDTNRDGIIQGRENAAAYAELTRTGGLERRDFLFKTGGPYYFSFTECAKEDGGYKVYFDDEPSGTCIFPSELKPWELQTDSAVNPKQTSERTVCLFELGFDDSNVMTGNIRRTTEGASWGSDLNNKLAAKKSPFDCFSDDINPSSTDHWRDAVIIRLW